MVQIFTCFGFVIQWTYHRDTSWKEIASAVTVSRLQLSMRSAKKAYQKDDSMITGKMPDMAYLSFSASHLAISWIMSPSLS